MAAKTPTPAAQQPNIFAPAAPKPEAPKKETTFEKQQKLLQESEAKAQEAAKLQEEFLAGARMKMEAAKEAPESIEKQAQANREVLRRQAAQALLAARGNTATPSGARLGQLRATGAQTGMMESQLLSEAAQRKLEAQMAAGEAAKEFAAEQKKLEDARIMAAAKISEVDNLVESTIDRFKGTIYTDQSDRNKMANFLEGKLKSYADHPEALARLISYINVLRAGGNKMTEANWSIDV